MGGSAAAAGGRIACRGPGSGLGQFPGVVADSAHLGIVVRCRAARHGRDGVPTWDWDARTEARNTSVSELAVPEVLPGAAAGEPVTYRVELEKRRRRQPHRYETRNLAGWGPNAPGRLITRAIEATAPARGLLAAHEVPAGRLLAWHVAKPLLVADRTELVRLGFADQDYLHQVWPRSVIVAQGAGVTRGPGGRWMVACARRGSSR
jgi:hypothetical protein